MDISSLQNHKLRRMFLNILSIFMIVAMAFPVTGSAYAQDEISPSPWLTAFPEWDFIEGFEWPLGSFVHLTVDDPTTDAVPDWESDDTAEPSPWGDPRTYVSFNFIGTYDLKPGDRVTLSDNVTERTLVVQNLAIVDVSADADTVTGTADAGAVVNVWPHETGEQIAVTTDDSGGWQVDLTDAYDMVPGSAGRAEIRDDLYNGTAVDWLIPNPWFTAFPEQDVIEGWDWPLGAVVHLTIDDPTTTDILPDHEQDETAVLAPWGSGQLWIWFEFPDAFNMKAGDIVTLSYGGIVRTHVVQNLSLTDIDPDENTVTGIADPGQTITLWSWEDSQGNRVETTAEDSGFWAADFDDVNFNLVPGQHVRAEVWSDGNDTAIDWDVSLPGWQQINVNGFGDLQNVGVTALEVFRGQLYAGASRGPAGGEVWRLGNDGQWSEVNETGFGSEAINSAIIDMAVFQGQIYAGIGWSGTNWNDPAGQIWRSPDGTNWQPVTTDGFGDDQNIAITNFIAYKGMLYAGTGSINTSAQIWRSRSGQSGSWTQVAPDQTGLAGNVTGFAVYKGELFAAIEPAGAAGAPIQVWSSNNGSDWTTITATGFEDERNVSSGGFAQFDGYLYLGTRNEETGAQLWRTYDGIHWEQVMGNGFGDLNNTKIESLLVHDDLLYATTYNLAMGLQLWRSTDGVIWEPVMFNGFGDGNNFSTLWNSAITEYQGGILIGTWNEAEGGELWMFTP